MKETELPPNVYYLEQRAFDAIPGAPWAYWATEKISQIFRDFSPITDIAVRPNPGATSDNFRFLRFSWEITPKALGPGRNWIIYTKGGGQRKWFGNLHVVIRWTQEARNFYRENIVAKITDERYWYREAATYSSISTNGFSVRYVPPLAVYDRGGPAVVFFDPGITSSGVGLLNSRLVAWILGLLNPSINTQGGDIDRIPVPPSDEISNSSLPSLTRHCVFIQRVTSFQDESTCDFIVPAQWQFALEDLKKLLTRRRLLEARIDDEVFHLYSIPDAERTLIEADLAGDSLADPDARSESQPKEHVEGEALEVFMSRQELAVRWMTYATGVALGRFRPGVPDAQGSAAYHQEDFAVGSLPAPEDSEFDELVGTRDRFVYIDDDGGRHIFSAEGEGRLAQLAIGDGIAVLDADHLRDLPALVDACLREMLGDEAAEEVIQEGTGGDLRKFIEKDFFTKHLIKQYRKRPVYWPIQSAKRSYGFVLFHEKIEKDTFYRLQREFLDPKRKSVQLKLEEIQAKLEGTSGRERKTLEKDLAETQDLAEELAQFAADLEEITSNGYEPEPHWIDDGVILRMAPLWKVIPLWQSEPKKYWERLENGDYDWSHIALRYWPERVTEKCKSNKSYAIAHGLENLYEGE